MEMEISEKAFDLITQVHRSGCELKLPIMMLKLVTPSGREVVKELVYARPTSTEGKLIYNVRDQINYEARV
jgi:hypothetical protein